jgi:predicted phage baseplate assembly protein
LLVSGRAKRALALQPLELVSEDGERRAIVAAGDSLIIVAASLVAGGRRRLLEDRNGFQGVVVGAGANALIEEAARANDPLRTELAVLKAVEDGEERTTLELETALSGWYDRQTVTIHANVARATHGESVADEPLGSGDATIANQRFRLARPPLTHVAAATPSGAAATLEVWVDGVRWSEAPALHGLGPAAECYTLRLDDDGTPRVLFGDGINGARLPTGQENVRTCYRVGIGLEGEVAAGRLTLLQKRPLGIRSVTNPLPANGAADPEDREQARSNAPVTVLSLDRIVSLSDYEDFSRAFAGIGKAQAVSLWNGETPVVHLTVGTASGEPVAESSDLMRKLRAAIQRYRDPSVPVVLQGYREQRFSIAARVLVEERRDRPTVHAAIVAALEAEFAFPRRGFGQAVTQAEVVARIQAVDGVVAVDLEALYREGSPPASATLLVASAAQRLGGRYQAAELLRLRPSGVTLAELPA